MSAGKKPVYKRWWFILIMAFLVIGTLGNLLESDESKEQRKKEEVLVAEKREKEKKEKEDKKEAEQKKKEEEKKLENTLKFEGELTTKVIDNQISININTNVPDGGIFEVFIVDGNLNTKSDFITVKKGKASVDFDIPDDWEPSYFAASAMFRFNLEDHPQPKEIKEIYGENGENLTGKLAEENNVGGKNATIPTTSVAYPSEEVVQEILDKEFNKAIDELIETTEGIIVDVKPRSSEWTIVNVIVSDAWYYSAEHEKERFAKQIGGLVQNLVNNSGKQSGTISVYFVDTYGEELASPKTLSDGYKIKK